MTGMLLMRILASDSHIPLNRMLMKILGINTAVYFSELCNYYAYFEAHGMLDDEDFFYVTHAYIERRTTLTARQQRFCEADLRERNLIDVKRKGMPAKNWYKINIEILEKMLNGVDADINVMVDENEEDISEDGTVQFDKIVKQDVTKCNDKIDKFVKQDVTKCYDKMLQNVTTATIYYNKDNRNKDNRYDSAVCPEGQTSEHSTSSVNDKQEDNFDDVLSPVKEKRTRKFSPPSLEEVKAYCEERKNSVDAQQFFDYYSAGDWKDASGSPVRNWKQKMIAVWEKKDAPVRAKQSPSAPSEPEEPPRGLVSAYDALGLHWGREHLSEYAENAREINRWRQRTRDNTDFTRRHDDLYAVFHYPEEFWRSYLEFMHDRITNAVPKPAHFKLGSPTFNCWCDEMGIEEEYRK